MMVWVGAGSGVDITVVVVEVGVDGLLSNADFNSIPPITNAGTANQMYLL